MNKRSAASGKVGSLLGTLSLTFQWAAGRLGTEFDTKTTGPDALLCCRCGMRCPSYLSVVFFFKTLFVFMRGQRGKQYIFFVFWSDLYGSLQHVASKHQSDGSVIARVFMSAEGLGFFV